ncbi:MAG: hypothetical protein E3J41_08335 [Candidatus Cloacimonadota bacterium]|nr:MAG: hypothetical protein E3J41_08335 [Candidatus Cloacimonadota bacterium]
MPGGIKAVKIIYQVLAWLGLIGCVLGGIGMMIAGGVIGATGEEGAVGGLAAFAGTGVFFIIMGVVVFILYFITAKGVANKRNWGKILAIIFGILMLPNIPIGTVLGIVILINIFGEQGKAWFAGTAGETTKPT